MIKMPPSSERSYDENVGNGGFKWGNKGGRGVKNKDIQYYESFFYEGVEYFLYDSVYFYHMDHVETSIGKLVKMFQTTTHAKMIKVVWFFRPSEIRNFFRNYKPQWNELFLASGKGKGVSNVNLLESIIGKCNVVCTSEDKRNPKPSETELKGADFFYKCTFDVDRCVIDDKFSDTIAGIEVEKFFNKKGDRKTSNNLHLETNRVPTKIKIKKRTYENVQDKDEVTDEVKAKTAPSDVLRCKDIGKDKVTTFENVSPIKMRTSENCKDKDVVNTKTAPSDILRCKDIVKDKVTTFENVSPIKMRTSENYKDKDEVKTKTAPSDILCCKVKDKVGTSENVSPKRVFDCNPFKKRKIIEEKSSIDQSSNYQKKDEFYEKQELRQDVSVQPNRKVTEVTERPNAEKRKWFKKMPWEERLLKAQESNTLVLLSNLDPSYSSDEVENLVWHVFKEKVEARMIESSLTSNTYYGRALVIFKNKDAAENALLELDRRCLILEDGRVVCARKGNVRDPTVKQSTFTGHLTLSRAALPKQSREMRNAVSTSHCSQPNTIEYAMAIEWIHQYDRSEACSAAICERQMKEIDNVKSKLRIDRIFFEAS